MKTLQNNFTTPEQSKRLLELGVPADSADCVRVVRTGMVFFMQNGKVTEGYLSLYKAVRGEEAEPCWSVGRLQEIAKICAKEKEYYYTSVDTVAHQQDFVEWWVKHFTLTDNVLFDFSKLEY